MSKKNNVLLLIILITQNIAASQEDQNMQLAIVQNNISKIMILIENGADSNTITDSNKTALNCFCQNIVLLRDYLNTITNIGGHTQNEKEWYTTIKNKEKKTYEQSIDLLNILLQKNVNPNNALFWMHNKYPEHTLPFLFAHIHNNTQSEKNKLDINTQNKNGDTPLHKAVEFNNNNFYYIQKPITLCLLELGADPTIKNNNGYTSLELAENNKLKKMLSEKSVRKIQMPYYKKGKRCNLFTMINQREYGIKRIGK